jgi:hypothetical protein
MIRGDTVKSNHQQVNLRLGNQAHSADPFEFDSVAHHIVFRPVFATLVSSYAREGVTGMVATSWSSSADLTDWTFKIRPGLKFSDGRPLTAADVARSLVRVAYLQKQRSSRSGLLEHVVGYDRVESPDALLQGIDASGDSLAIRFDRPMPRALEKLGSGMYGIVHPDDYDHQTGQWRDPRVAHASGAYSLDSWSETSLSLSLRTNSGLAPMADRPVQRWELTWDASVGHPDVIDGSDIAPPPGAEKFRFFGPALSNIAYIRCVSASTSGSPCESPEVRRAIRSRFYKLMASSVSITRSFFPKSVAGVREPDFADDDAPSVKLAGPVRYTANWNPKSPTLVAYESAIRGAIESLGGTPVPVPRMKVSEILHEIDPSTKAHAVDLLVMSTDLVVEDPDDDIRFMFRSSEGVRLPDQNGRIERLLGESRLDVQRVNQELWNESLVWTVAHFSSGLWVDPEVVDLSRLNLTLAPSDLARISVK